MTPDELFERGIALRDAGDLTGAIEVFRQVAESVPENPTTPVVIGSLYWRLGMLDQATEFFKTATQIAPNLELASLGLFHSLWKRGLQGTALAEMKRFLSMSSSNEYDSILEGINKGVDDPISDLGLPGQPM